MRHFVVSGTLALASTIAILSMASATASARYRTCATRVDSTHTLVKAEPSISCTSAVSITHAGIRTNGDDGARFHKLGHEWQCVTTALPRHGHWTQFGCFTPRYRTHDRDSNAIVTFLLFWPAD